MKKQAFVLIFILSLFAGKVAGQCVTIGPAMAAICQGGESAALGGAFTGDATSAVWSDGGAGGTFTNNGGATPDIVTYIAASNSTSPVTLTLTGSGGTTCTPLSDTKQIVVNPTPTATIGGTTTVCQNSTSPIITFTNPQTLPITITYDINGSDQTTINVGSSSSATVAAPTSVSGSFDYNLVSVVYQSAPACLNTLTGLATITVTPVNTITLSSGAGTNDQTRCINTALTAITFTTTGAAGITATGLPLGVTGQWASDVATISGTPTVSGSFPYTVTLTGGCGSISATGTITVNQDNAITLSSGAGSNNQTKCINSALTAITFTTTGATGATVTGLPAGVSGVWASHVVTISGTSTVSGSFPYTVTLTGGCGTITATGTITVPAINTITLSSGAGTNDQTKCINTALTAITFNTTGATGITVSGLPLGVTGIWSANVITISGIPTVPGSFPYTITLTGGCGTITATGTITVNPDDTITLSSGGSTDDQTKCINTNLTAITYTTTGATGASVSGLPTGVTSIWASNVVTISGTPTVSGSFPYSVTLTGGCGSVTANGTITVTVNNTITLSSGAGTRNQTKCINTALTAITFTTTGATGATVSGLPAGVSGIWASNVVTISGTPTESGSFPYTVTLTGGCGTITTNGTITVTPDNTVALSSGPGTNNQTICINKALTAVTFTTTGATGANVSGLPAGVSGIWASNVVTISGTPTEPGSFPYTVALTGGCGTITATGTIIVSPVVGTPDTPTPSASTICQGSANTTYTTSATNATSYTWSVTGTGNGISGTGTTGTVTWAAGFSGTATVRVTANGCYGPSASASTTITVRPTPTATISGTTSICQNASPPNITFTNPQTLAVIVTYNINGFNQATIPIGPGTSVIVTAPTTTAGTFVYNLSSVAYQTEPACSNNLTQSATVTVKALPIPTLTSSDADNSFCAGTSVTFTAGGGISYNFRVGGVTVQDGAEATYTTSSLSNGKSVDVIVTNANGCKATSASIINFVDVLPFIVISTPASCSADLTTYSLAVTVSSGIVTSSSGNITSLGGNAWSITGVTSGINDTITVTDGNSCQSILIVTAPNCSCPVVTAPVSGGDKSYCATGIIPTITATVSSGETVDWYNSSSGGTLLKRGSLSYTPSAAGTYYALTRNTTTGCVSSTRTAITITMNALPIPILISSDTDNIFCAGTSITFTAEGGTVYNFRLEGVSVQNGTLASYTTSSLTTGQALDVIVTNENGCTATSIGILNTVNALPIPSLTSSDADNKFCAGTSITFTAGGGTSYNFRVGGVSFQNGAKATYSTNVLSDGQVVDVIVTNVYGCSATSAGIANTVYALPIPVLTSSDADNMFCTGTSITFTSGGGINYDFSVGGLSKQSGPLATYTTSSLTNGQIVDVTVTNANGCSAKSSGITNTVYAIPATNAGTGGNVCDLNFKFSAVPSVGVGTWTKATGPGTVIFAPDANSATATVTVSEYGTYTFTWTEVNATCTNNATITVNFSQQPVVNPGTGGNNCGTDFFLNAVQSVGVGTWTKTAGPGTASFTPNASTPNSKVTVSAYGNYKFTWTEVNGTCSGSAFINVNFLQVPAANAGNDGSECDLDYILNAIPGAGTGSWSKLSGPGDAIFSPDPNQPGARVTVNKFGEYQFIWNEVNISCQSTDLIKVSFHDLPVISTGRDTIICKGESVQLDAQGLGSFLWEPDSLVNDPGIKNPLASPITTTLFKVTLTDQYACKNIDTIIIQVFSDPIAYAGPDQVLEYVFRTNMAATEPGINESGVWTVISGTGEVPYPSDAATSVIRLSPGKNIFLWTVTNGVCPPSHDSLEILIHDFVIPTLITPNMDGKNDYFVLKGIETLGKTDLTIFDRRGTQVYRNSKYDNKWNGVDYNEHPLPADTYFFVLKTENGKSISGYIVIRR